MPGIQDPNIMDEISRRRQAAISAGLSQIGSSLAPTPEQRADLQREQFRIKEEERPLDLGEQNEVQTIVREMGTMGGLQPGTDADTVAKELTQKLTRGGMEKLRNAYKVVLQRYTTQQKNKPKVPAGLSERNLQALASNLVSQRNNIVTSATILGTAGTPEIAAQLQDIDEQLAQVRAHIASAGGMKTVTPPKTGPAPAVPAAPGAAPAPQIPSTAAKANDYLKTLGY